MKATVGLQSPFQAVLPEATHLIEEQLPSLLLPEIHLLDGHLLARVLLGGDADDPRGALPDLDEAVQVLPGVAGADDQLQGGSELFVGHPGGLLVRGGAPAGRGVST